MLYPLTLKAEKRRLLSSTDGRTTSLLHVMADWVPSTTHSLVGHQAAMGMPNPIQSLGKGSAAEDAPRKKGVELDYVMTMGVASRLV
jgi:hypothetical protein